MAKPVIAAVNGVAAGAGASLAFACDLRLVADTAGFNLAFANVALSCDTGASYHLPLLVGRARALELLYFPRTIKADEALTLGLATKVVPADALAGEVGALARRLADGPTVALGAMRQSVAYAAGHSFEEALAFESAMMQKTGATADHSAAVAAFVAKEKPVFEGALSRPTERGPEDRQHLSRSHPGHPVPAGVGAVLDGERDAREPVVVPARHGAVADPAAVEGGGREVELVGDPAREPR